LAQTLPFDERGQQSEGYVNKVRFEATPAGFVVPRAEVTPLATEVDLPAMTFRLS